MQNVKNLSPLKIYVKQKIYKTSRPKTVKMVWSRAKCKSANRLKKKKKKTGPPGRGGAGLPRREVYRGVYCVNQTKDPNQAPPDSDWLTLDVPSLDI